MTIIFVLLIALAWAAWLLAWARDRYMSGAGTGFGSAGSARPAGGYLGMPTTPESARSRRRHVLIVLGVLSVAVFFGARYLTSLSVVSVVCVVTFVLYALAAAKVEMGSSREVRVTSGLPAQRRSSFEPITP